MLSASVLEHTTLTMFCEIPLVYVRENTIKELDLNKKGIGLPGAIVLSKLLLSNSSLESLTCARLTRYCSLPTMTCLLPMCLLLSQKRHPLLTVW